MDLSSATNLLGAAGVRSVSRAAVSAIIKAIRPVVARHRKAALQAFKTVIPVDTAMMKRSARARMSVRRGRPGFVVRVSVVFTFAGAEQVAFNALAARYRPDLKGWPVHWMQRAAWRDITEAARAAADPVIRSGVDRAVKAEFERIGREAQRQFNAAVRRGLRA